MHVVLLGSSRGATLALSGAGHQVTVVHEPWEADAVRSVNGIEDTHEVESLASVDALLVALAEPRVRIEAVVANSESSVISAAVVGHVLGARAIPVDVAVRCRDKLHQKHAWRTAGVTTTKYALIDSREDPVRKLDEAGIRPPFVMKPRRGFGCRNVRRIDEAATVRSALADVGPAPVLVEEYVNGHEWHLDGIVRNGELDAIHVARYLTPLLETKNGKPHVSIAIAPSADAKLYERARDFSLRALKAVGYQTGVFHFEVFTEKDSEEFIAGELAARVGGNSIWRLIQMTIGIDMWAAAAQVLVGDQVQRMAVSSGTQTLASMSVPSFGGENRVPPELVGTVPGVINFDAHIPDGHTSPRTTETSSACIGTALIGGADFDACADTAASVLELVQSYNGSPPNPRQND